MKSAGKNIERAAKNVKNSHREKNTERIVKSKDRVCAFSSVCVRVGGPY